MLIIEKTFLLFIIYSTLGWMLEVTWVTLFTKKVTNRGFLIGPYCPIYGTSAVCMSLLLQKYSEDYIAVFVLAAVMCTIIEYITSYIMEKMFKARWWNYSDKKGNINGRVCVQNSALFGLLGVVLVCHINPFLMNILDSVTINTLNIVATVLFAIFLTDNIISFNVISSVKNLATEINKDSTTEITTRVREILREKSFFTRRLASAYPNLTMMLKATKEQLEKKREALVNNVKVRLKGKNELLDMAGKRFKKRF